MDGKPWNPQVAPALFSGAHSLVGREDLREWCKFLFFGKYKARRDLFHPSGGGGIKDNILDAAGRKQFGRIVGDNPDIKVVKDKIVLSGRGDRFKGKEFETGLNAADYLDGQ